MLRPGARSCAYTLLSRLPEYTTRSALSSASAHTESACASKVVRSRCMPTSHTRTVASEDPLTHVRPAASMRTERTFSVCPRNLHTLAPERASQSRTTCSGPPAATSVPDSSMATQ